LQVARDAELIKHRFSARFKAPHGVQNVNLPEVCASGFESWPNSVRRIILGTQKTTVSIAQVGQANLAMLLVAAST
jgi:hypothetical protein